MIRRRLAELPATLHLALPIMAGNVAQMLMGAIDTLMVGRLGVTPLAACAFGNSVTAFLLLCGIGVMQPVSILGAQAYGAGRKRELGEVLRAGLVVGAVAGILAGIVSHFLEWKLDLFGQSPEVTEESRLFLLLMGWSILPSVLVTGLKQFAEVLNRPWTPMLMIFAGVGVNALLNWIFIFGNLGAPKMGLAGAGLATLIARVLTCVMLFIWICRAAGFRELLPERWFGAVRWERVREMFTLGWPVSMQLMIEVGAFGFAAILMGWLNAESLAAHQIALTCAATTFMVPLGISAAVSMRVGKAWGGGNGVQVRDIGYSGFWFTGALMGLTGLVLFLGRTEIPGWFLENDARALAVLGVAERLLVVAAIFQLFDGIQIVGHGCLRGLGDVRVPTWISFLAYWMVALPLSWFLGFTLKLEGLGIWIGLATGLLIAAVTLVLRFDRMSRGERMGDIEPRRLSEAGGALP